MKILDIYAQYRLMPNLQEHMFRVAGVAQLICDHMTLPVDRSEVITACLLHDMGNILKFDLTVFPEFLRSKGVAYWQSVKADFHQKYGESEHEATLQIAREIGVNDRVIELISAIGFRQAKENYESVDFGRKICAYADMRVAPFGVTTLQKRSEDLAHRYSAHYPGPTQKAERERFVQFLTKVETQIFEKCDIQPTDLTEDRIQKSIPLLKEWQITK